jgi:hypothetical protein
MNAQDTILDEITRKQLIWYGHVERTNRTRLPTVMINWKREGWELYSFEWRRSKNGRMEQSKAMEYGSRKASPDVLKPCNIYIHRCVRPLPLSVTGLSAESNQKCELLKPSAHSKTRIHKFCFLFNSNWLMAGQPIYLLNFLMPTLRLELRTLSGYKT